MVWVKIDQLSVGEFSAERIVTLKTLDGDVMLSFWEGCSNFNANKMICEIQKVEPNRYSSAQERWRGPASFRLAQKKVVYA